MATKGIINSLVKLLLSAGAVLMGIMVLWRLLLIPSEIVLHPIEVRYLASPLEVMVIAYIVMWALKKYKFGIVGERFTVVSAALKASIVFYSVGLVTILMGYAGLCGPVGFVAAALYSLRSSILTKNMALPHISKLSSAVSIPVPSLNGPDELPIGLCTPPENDAMMAFNVHLGREARSCISFSQKRSHLRTKAFQLHVEKLVTILGSQTHSGGEVITPNDIQNHLSKKISRGYLIDPSKSTAEALKALNTVGRRGVEVSIQFMWTRGKEGIFARHLIAASSNDLPAFSRFESDLIRRLPFVNFLEAPLVVGLMGDLRRGEFLKPVGEAYLKEILPLSISYEPSSLLDRVTPSGYIESRGKKQGALSFPFPEGHMLLVGDKSSGKTRFAQSLVSALVEMNTVVIILGPHEEYSVKGRSKENDYLNPFRPPLNVDVLTHSGSLLVFSPSLAAAFSVEEPQDEVAKMIKLKEPLLRNYLAGIAGKVDQETSRIRAAISKLIEETGIDEAITGIALPDPMQNIIAVEVPLHRKATATLLTELFLAWAASLAISKRTVRVVMMIEDADELLNMREGSSILEYAEYYGLSLILISRSCIPLIPLGQRFSIITGFRMSRKADAEAFRMLVGLGGEEPEGLQIEATISGLHRGESLLFLRSSFDFLMAKASEIRGGGT